MFLYMLEEQDEWSICLDGLAWPWVVGYAIFITLQIREYIKQLLMDCIWTDEPSMTSKRERIEIWDGKIFLTSRDGNLLTFKLDDELERELYGNPNVMSLQEWSVIFDFISIEWWGSMDIDMRLVTGILGFEPNVQYWVKNPPYWWGGSYSENLSSYTTVTFRIWSTTKAARSYWWRLEFWSVSKDESVKCRIREKIKP